MRVRFFITTLRGGGAEKVLVDLLSQLTEKGIMCTVVTVDGGVYESKVSSICQYIKISKLNGVLGAIQKRLLYHMPARMFCRLFLRGKNDIEIAYLEGFPTRIVARKSNCKKLAFVHCDFSVSFPVSSLYKNKKACLEEYEKFDRVCFVSEDAKSGFENLLGELHNAVILHNVLNYHEVIEKSKIKCSDRFETNGLKLLTVGRLCTQKGYDRLFKVVAKLEKNYSFELWVIGEGGLRNELETLIDEYEIHSIKMLGFRDNPYCYMKQADVFVCSSRFEGYSTVVTEAKLCELPILTTECSGMNELLSYGKYGWIVENSEEGIYKGLKILLDCPDKLKEKKQSIIKDLPTFYEKNATEYINLFNEVLDYNCSE